MLGKELWVRVTPSTVENALKVLFGENSRHSSFTSLRNLDRGTLKSAFRQRAMDCHPDLAQQLQINGQTLDELFKKLHGAHRLLRRLVDNDSTIVIIEPRNVPEPRVNIRKNDERRFNYQGPMPRMPLRFAQFLFYSGIIGWDTLIDALTWQVRVRPKIGDIGREYRFLSHKHIIEVIRNTNRSELFGTTALRLGLLDTFQLNVLLGKQHNMNCPIGRYFLENKVLSDRQIRAFVEKKKAHNLIVRRVYR